MILCVAAAALLCGCESQGYVSGVNPNEAEAAARSVKPRYYVSALTMRSDSGYDNSKSTPCFVFRGYAPGAVLPRHEFQEECRRQFMLRARERHPDVFASDGEEAISISVDVKAERGETFIAGFLPFILSATLLPGKEHDNYVLTVGIAPGPKQGELKPMAPRCFPAEHICYISLLPWGLIYWEDTARLTIKPQRYVGDADYIAERQKERLYSCVDAVVLSLLENQAELAKLTPVVVGPPVVRGYAPPAQPQGAEPQSKGPGGGLVAPPVQNGNAPANNFSGVGSL